MGFIFKFLLFSFVFIYIGGKILGFLLKYFIRTKLKDFEAKNNYQSPYQAPPDGKVRVENPGTPKNNSGKTGGGEYVDFEEIK